MLAWISLSACTRGSDSPPRLDAQPASLRPSPFAPPPVSGSPAQNLSEALLDVCPDLSPTAPDIGVALHRVTFEASPYRCNDGTPPVLYVRAATDPEHADDWVIHFDGGASCSDHQGCVDRWCAQGNYDAADMSSAWSPVSIAAGGILGLNEANTLRGYNIAQLYYCSSDNWLGTRPQTILLPEPPDPSDTGEILQAPPLSVRFEGDGIVSYAMARLAEGLTSDDGTQTLPPVTSADLVLVAGSSAGGYGAAMQLNDIAEHLPSARILGVIDSSLIPSRTALDLPQQKQLDATLYADWGIVREAAWGPRADARGAAEMAEDERWRCFDLDLLLERYIDLPIAAHYDIYDPVPAPFFARAGIDEEQYPVVCAETLRIYSARPGYAVHGSACGLHMSLIEDRTFLGMAVTDAVKGGPAASMHGVLGAMLGGYPLGVVDDPAAMGSLCPP